MKKKIMLFLVFGFAILLLSGCYHVMIKVNINPDGSGTLEEKFLVSDFISEMGMGEQDNDQARTSEDLEQIYDEEALTKNGLNYGEGLVLKERKIISANEQSDLTGYKAIYEFTDITKIRIDENFSSKLDMNTGMMGSMSESAVRYITFDLARGKTNNLSINFPPDPPVGEMEEIDRKPEKIEEIDEEEFNMMKMFFQDMYFGLEVNINGKITETNADFHDGSKITLIDMDFAKMMENEKAFKAMMNKKDSDSAAMEKILKEDFSEVRYESKDVVKVKFK